MTQTSNTIIVDEGKVLSILDNNDIRDWLGIPRGLINDADVDTEVFDAILRSALHDIERHCKRSIIVKKYETTSALKDFKLIRDVTEIKDIQAWNGKVWLSAKKEEFDAVWEQLTDTIFIDDPPEDCYTFKATYMSGYKKIPEPLQIAMKEYCRIRYKRSNEDPMRVIQGRLAGYTLRDKETYEVAVPDNYTGINRSRFG